ncbi:hypothetical protein [Pleionea litopenaei]|uniref:ParG protein n=1 Tax=Pleionea litopenaei TaxID=3070815 RepID=A0AA51RX93_9GAMM|nr:hypothetical protein [Pleionea sp. HL-JVS1]WMS89297.1 hypothetical protein Q9312_19375 [Pleionea sp. HL-JVS1]WMS89318.1 hypothetical protein Q9312_19265 [Pleionea sp. HL-JVS1]
MALKAKVSTRENEGKAAAIKEVTKEKTSRLNANIPESLYKQLKMKAAADDKKINDLVIEWIEKYLSN